MKSALYFLPDPKERHIDQKTFYRTAIIKYIHERLYLSNYPTWTYLSVKRI